MIINHSGKLIFVKTSTFEIFYLNFLLDTSFRNPRIKIERSEIFVLLQKLLWKRLYSTVDLFRVKALSKRLRL